MPISRVRRDVFTLYSFFSKLHNAIQYDFYLASDKITLNASVEKLFGGKDFSCTYLLVTRRKKFLRPLLFV